MTDAKGIQEEAKRWWFTGWRERIFHFAVRHAKCLGQSQSAVKVTINGYRWRSTVGNRGGQQYLVVNAEARRSADVKAGDVVTITLEPDTEKREIEIATALQKALGTKLTQKLKSLSFTQKRIHRLVFRSEAGGHTCSATPEDEADARNRESH
jgi:Domain of unknown function (DUF1905)